jgi:hypothetical protein
MRATDTEFLHHNAEGEAHMATSPEEGMASLVRNLEVSTGKSMTTWIAEARSTGIGKHKLLVEYLKQEQGLSHGYAHQIALRALAPKDAPSAGGEAQIEAQYAGPKAALKPVYEALVAAVQAFGPDVELSPKKGYVSLRRTKQFAIFQPSTAQRLDVGLILKDGSAEERLEKAGSFNAMMTHRVRVGGVAEVDAALIGWLRRAYESA